MSKIINLTPHKIVIHGIDGAAYAYESEGVARVTSTPGHVDSSYFLDGDIPVFRPDVVGKIEGLPEFKEGICYIVSAVVASALAGSGRYDVLALGTGPDDGAIRVNGQIVAVTRLKRVY
jgi:hypothetical protein